MNALSLLQEVDIDHKHAVLSGLSAEQVLESRAQFGENRLPSEMGVSVWTILFNQVKSPLVYLILAAAAISLALGEFGDFAINSIAYIFAYRSMRLPIYRMNKLTANKPLIWAVVAGFLTIAIAFLVPGLRELLGIVPLSLQGWLWVMGVAFTLLVFVEIAKAIGNRLHPDD